MGCGGGGGGGHSGQSYNYTFHGDPHAMFAEFFGGRSPFDHFFSQNGEDDMEVNNPFGAFGIGRMGGFPRQFKPHPGGPHRAQQRRKDPPVVHELKVSLEEVFSGCTKKMKISRKRLNPDGCTMRSEDKILTVDIKRGWKEGTKITFPKEGDEAPANIPADVVFVVKDKPHPVFRREGSDIIYPAKISLRDVSERPTAETARCLQSELTITMFSSPAGAVWLHGQRPDAGRPDHHCDLQRRGQTRNQEADRRGRSPSVQVSAMSTRHIRT